MRRTVTGSYGPTFVAVNRLIKVGAFSGCFGTFNFTRGANVSLPNRSHSACRGRRGVNIIRLTSSSFNRAFGMAPVRVVTTISTTMGNNCLIRPRLISGAISSRNGIMGDADAACGERIVSRAASSAVHRLVRFMTGGNTGGSLITNCEVNTGANASRGISGVRTANSGCLCVNSYVAITPVSGPRVIIFMVLSRPGNSGCCNNIVSTPMGSGVVTSMLPCLNCRPDCDSRRVGGLTVSIPSMGNDSLASTGTGVAGSGLRCGIMNNNSAIVHRLPRTNGGITANNMMVLCARGDRIDAMAIPSFANLATARIGAATTGLNLGIRFSNGVSVSKLGTCGRDVTGGAAIRINAVVAICFHSRATMS